LLLLRSNDPSIGYMTAGTPNSYLALEGVVW
jgi:hypothetical protein